ncbi:hypothetical protein Hanom_Chr01g00036731 [Helianthus anomalus]
MNWPHRVSNVLFESSHNTCCVYDETLPKMVVFKENFEFMKRLPIQKALMNPHKVFKSHVHHFWKNASYAKENEKLRKALLKKSKQRDEFFKSF